MHTERSECHAKSLDVFKETTIHNTLAFCMKNKFLLHNFYISYSWLAGNKYVLEILLFAAQKLNGFAENSLHETKANMNFTSSN